MSMSSSSSIGCSSLKEQSLFKPSFFIPSINILLGSDSLMSRMNEKFDTDFYLDLDLDFDLSSLEFLTFLTGLLLYLSNLPLSQFLFSKFLRWDG